MRRDGDVMLQRRQSWKLGHQVRNTLAGLGEVFEYQPHRSRAVVSQMNFGNSDATAAFATKHSVVFDQTFGDISLSDRNTDNAAPMTRRDDVDRAGRRNVCDDRARFPAQTNISGDGERHLFREWLAKV